MAEYVLEATDEMIDATDCPWCEAGPGERCYGEYVGDELSRRLSDTHFARFKDVRTNRVRPLRSEK